MTNVTSRIKAVKQPRGGYLNPNKLIKQQFNDDKTLGEENIHAVTMGLVVDYLTRFQYFGNKNEAFHISILGAIRSGHIDEFNSYLDKIVDLSDESIENACRVVNYDVYYRAGMPPSKDSKDIFVDKSTCNNIRVMVNRSISFFDKYGPITSSGFSFEGGYSSIITIGDGDYLTKDTLWDFKVSKNPPTNIHTLQLLVYYIMGKHSINDCFKSIKNIGIFNPRLNCVYTFDVTTLDKSIIDQIESDVICY